MRALAVSRTHKLVSLLAVGALALGLVPALGSQPAAVADEAEDAAAPLAGAAPSSLGEGGRDQGEAGPDGSSSRFESVPLVVASQLSREVELEPLAEEDGVPLVADALAGKPTRFVNQEVSLAGDAEPVLGSFTVDGLTFAVTGEGEVELVAVSSDALAGGQRAGSSGSSADDRDAALAGMAADALAGGAADGEAEGFSEPVALSVPGTVEHDGAAYSVASVGPRAFACCAADVASLPATVEAVDEAAFRGSSVGAVEVEEGSPYLASYEGVLYDADFSDLLLIPEGKEGAVRIHSNASAITPGAFSHCASVTSVEVDAGNGSFYVEDGALRKRLADGAWADSAKSDAVAALGGAVLANAAAKSTNPYVYVANKTGARLSVGFYLLDSASIDSADADKRFAFINDLKAGPYYRTNENASYASDAELVAGAETINAFDSLKWGGSTVTSPGSIVQRKLMGIRWCQDGLFFNVQESASVPTGSGGTNASYGRKWYSLGYREDVGFGIAYQPTLLLDREGNLIPYQDWWVGDSSIPSDGLYLGFTGIGGYGPKYTVSFNANGGTGGQSSSVTATYSAAMPSISTTKPTRTGYTFMGWYDNADYTKGTQYYTAACASARTWDKTSATTLYAGWKASTSTVKFNVNGGGGSGYQTADKTATYGSAMPAISTTKPTRTGYTFMGWYDNADYTKGTQYYTAACASARTWNKTATTTLYAGWKAATATVKFNVNGGGGSGYQTADKTATYGSAMPAISTTKPTRTGYTFMGWYDNANYAASGAKQYYTAACASARTWDKTATTTLYAGWKANAYTVGFNANGGTGGQSANVTATYGSAMPGISTTKPTRTGYAFMGWYDNADYAKGTQYYNASCASARTWDKTATTTLYAGWKANAYTVGFSANGGTGGQSANVTATYGSAMPGISTTKPTRTGYAFMGWYDNADYAKGTQYYNASCASARTWDKTATTTLYAGWRANTYDVRYFTKSGEHIGTDQKAYDEWFNLRGDPKGTHPAYTAKGWARSANQTSASHAFALWTRNLASAQGASFDLYVAEAASTYSVSYDAAGGQLSGQRTEYTFETPDFRLAEPVRTGYAFLGWEVTGAAAGSAGVAQSGASSTVRQGTWGDLSCVARWEASECQVALDASFPEFATGPTYEGYAPHGVSKDAGAASVTATFDSAMPAAAMPRATGYAFLGYFDDAGVKYYDADGSSARTWDKPGDATLHGRWAVERHELTLDVGDGEVPDAAARGWSRDDGEAGLYRLSYSIEWAQESGGSPRIQLPVSAAKPGYASFDGWVGPGLSKPSARVQVQPWELADRAYVGAFSGAIRYAASLDLAGGSLAEAPEGWSEAGGAWSRAFTVESEAFQLPTPSRAGHDFQGWALVQSDGSLGSPAKDVTVPKGTVGDRSYRAVWQARTYTVTWHYSGQAIDGRQSVTAAQAYGSPIAFPSRPSVADPARDHYSFAGWFTAREGGERVEAGDYLVEGDATYYARWSPVEYVAHLHLGDDDAYAERKARIEQGGQALPMAPDGHFDLPYTVEDAVTLPTVTDDPEALKPVREGMEFKGWVECAEDGSYDGSLVPSMEVTLPAGSSGERHFRALWSVALRFEVPSAVSFRFDLADDPAFADEPYGPVAKVEGDGVELRSLSAAPLAVADVALDVAGARPDDIVTDRSKVSLRVMDASSSYGYGWVPLPTTAAPERLDPFDLEPLGFGEGNAVAPLSSKPLRYEVEVQQPQSTLAGEVSGLPLAKVVFTVKGLW